MKGYKAFNADMTCRGFQYEIGKTYAIDDKIELCETGFHFCKSIADCFYYYPNTDARFAEVEALGDVTEADDDSKCVTNKIKILKEIPRSEAVDMSNTGHRNTGNWNTGHRNTGHRNTGHRNTGHRNTGNWNTGHRNTGDWNTGRRNTGHSNTGDWNTGHRNTGDWNTGDWNTTNFSSGCFNTEPQKIIMFNKLSEWTLDDYINSNAARILFGVPKEIDVIELIYSSDMTEEEKQAHPEHETTGCYLKVTKSNGNRQEWWDNLPQEDKDEVMSLPNFDKEVFKECTGIDVESEE